MRILFTGYAPVHFQCFKPLYDRLAAIPGTELQVSGGTRSKSPHALGGYLYDHEAMYRQFELPEGSVLPVASLAKADYDVIVMNSDLYFHPALLVRLRELEGDALLYDSASGEEDEQMKVRVDHGRLVEMSKVMRSDRVCGENVGMLRLSSTSMRHVADAARAIAAAGGERAWLAAAINQVAVDHPIRCVDVAGWPWVEIDFPEDLARARSEVFPAVAGEMAMESYGLLGVHSMAGCAR